MEYPEDYGINTLAWQTLRKKNGKRLSSMEIAEYIKGMHKILSEAEPALSDTENAQSESISNYPKAIQYLIKEGITKESAVQFFKDYNEMLRNSDWTVPLLPPAEIPVSELTSAKDTGQEPVLKLPFIRPYTRSIDAYPPEIFTGENLHLQDDEFSWLSSIAMNSTTEVSNRLPSALQQGGYWVKPLSIYVKAGGVFGLGWTLRDMKQDWNTYSGGRLAIAWTADVIPIGASVLGAYGLGTFGILAGSLGSVIGGTSGDLLKYEIKKTLPKDAPNQ